MHSMTPSSHHNSNALYERIGYDKKNWMHGRNTKKKLKLVDEIIMPENNAYTHNRASDRVVFTHCR